MNSMTTKKNEFNPFVNLPGETIIDVVFINGNRIMITQMTFKESYFLKNNPQWIKKNYQIGISTFKATETFDKNKII